MTPASRFKLQAFRILKYDDNLYEMNLDKTAYLGSLDNYSSIPWLKVGWTIPFVTGHKYKIHWGTVGLDWDQARITLSERWAESDKHVYFVHNFTDVRQKYDVKVNSMAIDSANFLNDTIKDKTAD